MVLNTAHRPVGRPREFDEAVALQAAMNAFWRKGYEATSLTDLCRCMGINKASLYRVFGDKHRLFKAALQHYADTEFRETLAVVRPEESPLCNIRAVIRKISADAGNEKGCLMINSIVELAPHDAEVRRMLAGFGEKRVRALNELISAAHQAGEIRAELEPHKLARQLMITLAGSATMIKGFMPAEEIAENLDNLIDSWS